MAYTIIMAEINKFSLKFIIKIITPIKSNILNTEI